MAAFVVPLIATCAVPARFAIAVLGGWMGANAVAVVNFVLIWGYESNLSYQFTVAPVIAFAVTLAALTVAITLFARAAVRREA